MDVFGLGFGRLIETAKNNFMLTEDYTEDMLRNIGEVIFISRMKNRCLPAIHRSSLHTENARK